MKSILCIFSILLLQMPNVVYTQKINPFLFHDNNLKSLTGPVLSQAQLDSLVTSIGKRKIDFTKEDWQKIIDAYWGAGITANEELAIFDDYWKRIDEQFACFRGIDVDWDSVKATYRPEIETGVSRGRFAAILTHMADQLMDAHTYAHDTLIEATFPDPNVPVFWVNGSYLKNRFGAGLTPLADSSLLVYVALNDQPLGLQPGDRILGYDNQSWHSIYTKLIDDELPMVIHNTGSTHESFYHLFMRSAGNNWHLFDTIDIVKYHQTDTIHLPTT